MARGKHGRSAALRRESAEVTTTIEDYKRAVAKLAQERDALSETLDRERLGRLAEVTKLRRLIAAGAAPEVIARDREIRELRQSVNIGRSFADDLMLKDDFLIYNACRYVSMTTGARPVIAIGMVITWCTNEDFLWSELAVDKLIVDLGIHPKGWVANQLRHYNAMARTKTFSSGDVPGSDRGDPVAALNLDHAIEVGHKDIHPSFRKHWYPDLDYRWMRVAG